MPYSAYNNYYRFDEVMYLLSHDKPHRYLTYWTDMQDTIQAGLKRQKIMYEINLSHTSGGCY